MPYKVDVKIANAYASLTVKDWLSDSPCVDTQTGTKLENVPVQPTTFHVLIGHSNGVGGVIIYDTVPNVAPVPSNYEIPRELDETGTITFPKPKRALQSDLDNLDAQVKNLTQQIAGNKRGK
ncbi:hypothetical protein [Rhizobium sophoriradicis]|uniref:Uncharacterized protein n=1 Tax=Rhizobium sophoriradicis TaxID=1535245 RepID=A0A2A5KVB5_9HYPH|nr:hypothetical protein [Rhizobium sophoriradicis]PCK80911.1 hypothetical protein CPT34_12160 [Rhizobium sophoriradicis]